MADLQIRCDEEWVVPMQVEGRVIMALKGLNCRVGPHPSFFVGASISANQCF